MNFLDEKLPELFWDKVYPCPMSGCWLWAGATNGAGGYGVFRATGRHYTHRFTLGAVERLIPTLDVDHKCRNRLCCNPCHLEQVTRRENIRRGISRNRDKTMCSKGHRLSGVNLETYTRRGFHERRCKRCKADQQRVRRAKHLANAKKAKK